MPSFFREFSPGAFDLSQGRFSYCSGRSAKLREIDVESFWDDGVCEDYFEDDDKDAFRKDARKFSTITLSDRLFGSTVTFGAVESLSDGSDTLRLFLEANPPATFVPTPEMLNSQGQYIHLFIKTQLRLNY